MLNIATCMLLGEPGFHHATPLLQELHGYFFFQAQFLVPFITYKVLYSPGPGYMKDSLALHISAQVLRGADEGLLQVPPLAETTMVGTWERTFSMVAPRRWNTLPMEAYLAPSVLVFHGILNLGLFKLGFYPPR